MCHMCRIAEQSHHGHGFSLPFPRLPAVKVHMKIGKNIWNSSILLTWINIPIFLSSLNFIIIIIFGHFETIIILNHHPNPPPSPPQKKKKTHHGKQLPTPNLTEFPSPPGGFGPITGLSTFSTFTLAAPDRRKWWLEVDIPCMYIYTHIYTYIQFTYPPQV